ncbi:hypothetical protein [Streptomyces sp. NPDC002054]|uniref:hypothetical protein n=1 Tax=Streptomyces sp. NPDC002054 TaxID=3154663 RepID=UPI003316FDF5
MKSRQADVRKEKTAAQEAVRAARLAYESTVSSLEAERKELRATPERGALKEKFGALALHEHALVINGKELPLDRLDVSLEPRDDTVYLRVKTPTPELEYVPFPAGEYSEDSVRGFEVRLTNAVGVEHRFLERRAARVPEVEAALAVARADTADRDEAENHLRAVIARQDGDEQLAAATADWEAARAEWQKLTGYRPPL